MDIPQPIKPIGHFIGKYSSVGEIKLETVNKHIGEQKHV